MFTDTEFSTVSDTFCWIGWIDSCMALTVASSLAPSYASRRFSMAFSDSVSVSCVFSFGVVRFDCLCACANRVGICGLQVLQAQNISSLATTGSSLFLMSAQFMQCQSRQKLRSIGVPLLLSDSHSFLHDAQWLSSFLRQQTHIFVLSFSSSPFWLRSDLPTPSWMAFLATDAPSVSPLMWRLMLSAISDSLDITVLPLFLSYIGMKGYDWCNISLEFEEKIICEKFASPASQTGTGNEGIISILSVPSKEKFCFFQTVCKP